MNELEVRRVVTGPVEENCYLVSLAGRDDCVIVDPGDEAERIRDALGGRAVAAILLTHGHFDHVGDAAALADSGTPVLIHEDDLAMPADPVLNASWLTGARTAYPAPDGTFRDGDTLTLAGLTIRVLHTPGHTPGSCCFEIGDCLFTGDTVMTAGNGIGRTDLPGGSMAAMRASLRRLEPLLGNYRILGGHG